jgi:hypothetical protein
MFPSSEYALTWEFLSAQLPERQACRMMVDLLDLANQFNVVAELAQELDELLERRALPDIEALRSRLAPRQASVPEVHVVLPSTADYDELLEVA